MDLVSLFQWGSASDMKRACDQLNRGYLRRRAGSLNHVLSKDQGGNLPPELAPERLAAEMNGLPDRAYLRILRSPETCYHLALANEGEIAGLLRHLRASIDAEHRRLDDSLTLDADTWSAMDDLYFPGKGREVERLDAEDELEWSIDRPYQAPLLHDLVVVDFHSPRSRRALQKNSFRPRPYGPAEPLSADERRSVLAKMQEAMDGIAALSPAAHTFVANTVHVVIPRKQTNPEFYPSSFKGSSSKRFIGRSNLFNAHYDYIDAANVAQSIVHEGIHLHLYKLEEEQPLFTDARTTDDARIKSPWTGNSINLYAFVHGSIVFFAIMKLFRLPGAEKYFSEKHITYYVEQGRAGFANRAMMACLEPYRSVIPAPIFEQLEQFQRLALEIT